MNTNTNIDRLCARFPIIFADAHTLLDLANNPRTIDNERYARKARSLAKWCADAMRARETSTAATQVRTIFVGLHRLLDWDTPVAINAHLIRTALDAADELSVYNVDECTCVSNPDTFCFSDDHLD